MVGLTFGHTVARQWKITMHDMYFTSECGQNSNYRHMSLAIRNTTSITYEIIVIPSLVSVQSGIIYCRPNCTFVVLTVLFRAEIRAFS